MIHKSGAEWRSEGTALYYALSFEQFTNGFGLFLLQFPWLLKVATYIAFWSEAIGPLLLISPLSNGPLRTAGVAVLLALLVCILLVLNIGLFIWVTGAGLLALLPAWFWDKIESWVRSKEWRSATVYFDSECGFCRISVQIVGTFFPDDKLSLSPGHRLSEIEAEMKHRNSWVVADESGACHSGFDAAIILARCNPFSMGSNSHEWSLAKTLGQSDTRSDRKSSAKSLSCTNDESFKGVRFPRFDMVQSVVVLCILGYVFLWNVASLPDSPVRFSERARSLGEILGLDQEWRMFAPFPGKDDGWYVVPGKLKNGNIVDLFNHGAPVTWAKAAFAICYV